MSLVLVSPSQEIALKVSVIFFFNNFPKKLRYGLYKKVKFLNFFIPPFIAICSLILFSSSFIYFYNPIDNIEKKELINPE